MIAPPKTPKSNRVVMLPEVLKTVLHDYMEKCYAKCFNGTPRHEPTLWFFDKAKTHTDKKDEIYYHPESN